MSDIKIVETDNEISDCFNVLSQLRPHVEEQEFLQRVRRMSADGYRLACLFDAGEIKVVAGFRISESFAWGKYLYIDDLVSAESERSQGYGGRMFDWLVKYAHANKCEQLHLESGVQRFAAHRFYLRKGMNISSHHFQLRLSDGDQ